MMFNLIFNPFTGLHKKLIVHFIQKKQCTQCYNSSCLNLPFNRVVLLCLVMYNHDFYYIRGLCFYIQHTAHNQDPDNIWEWNILSSR